MAKGAYIGISNTARNIENMYVGVNGVARKVTKAYVGINGVAHQFYPSVEPLDKRVFTLTCPEAFIARIHYAPVYDTDNETILYYRTMYDGRMFYSTNQSNWTELPSTNSTSMISVTASLQSGNYKVYLRGIGNTSVTKYQSSKAQKFLTLRNTSEEHLESVVDISGNIETLLDYTQVNNNVHPTMANDCFSDLMYGLGSNDSLSITANNLNISAGIERVPSGCFSSMFTGHSMLLIPDFLSTTIGQGSYVLAFGVLGSIPLQRLPLFRSSILEKQALQTMFGVSLPTLPEYADNWLSSITTMGKQCINNLFSSDSIQDRLNLRNVTTIQSGGLETGLSYPITFSNKLQSVESPANNTRNIRFEFTDSDSYTWDPGVFVGSKGTSKSTATYTFYTDNTSMKNAFSAKADEYTTVNVYHLDGSAW